MNHPNLLFIYTDEQAFNTLRAYGNDRIQMPNLDRLAEVSCVFERTYVTQTVCTPSRSSLLTGLYPHTNGCTENNIPLAKDVKCVPEFFEPDRYVTAHFGKWHLGDEIFPQHGFDHWASVEDEYQKYFSEGRDKTLKSQYNNWLIDKGLTPENGVFFQRKEAARLPEEFSKAAYVADMSCDFIRRNAHNPFILYANFFEPHMPFFGPRDNQYDPANIPLPANFTAAPTDRNPLKTRIMREQFFRHGHSGLPLRTVQDWQRMVANYWGLCSLVDTHIGRIVDCLEQAGLMDDTLVVFTSDHGDMMGSHLLLTKCFMFEEAARVPLLIKLPGQRQGRRIDGAVSQIDLVPTILDYLGAGVPSELQGQSLRPQIEGAPPSRDVFIEWTGGNNGLGDVVGQVSTREWMHEVYTDDQIVSAMSDPTRTVITQDGWKFTYSQFGEHELYNLNDDPFETDNCFRRADSALLNTLVGKIIDWQHATNDSVSMKTFATPVRQLQ